MRSLWQRRNTRQPFYKQKSGQCACIVQELLITQGDAYVSIQGWMETKIENVAWHDMSIRNFLNN